MCNVVGNKPFMSQFKVAMRPIGSLAASLLTYNSRREKTRVFFSVGLKV